MTTAARTPASFRYLSFDLGADGTTLACHYAVGGETFTERFELEVPEGLVGGGAPRAVVEAAATLVHLTAGVSYYKTSAPQEIDLGALPTGPEHRDFVHRFYTEGLGEFAHRNRLDLRGLRVVPGAEATGGPPGGGAGQGVLIPFGGGIDSIVTTEDLHRRFSSAALFVVSPAGRRFVAIEQPAAVAGLPVVRVARRLDDKVLDPARHGFLNGHVPVTGILSALAVWAAASVGLGTVAMSNEWSASEGSRLPDGSVVNHQYSKSFDFEERFRRLLAATLGGSVSYFSYLRPRSELWVARRFAELTAYHRAFRSCNRAFAVDPARRLDHWCGTCDKCCFVDLVLGPFLARRDLETIFSGREPLGDPGLADRFGALLGLGGHKPFECVGVTEECQVAARLVADRADRADQELVRALAAAVGQPPRTLEELLRPLGPHFVPDAYAPQDLLV